MDGVTRNVGQIPNADHIDLTDWAICEENQNNNDLQDSLKEADALYKARDFDEAFPLYQHLAKTYNIELAWCRLGAMHEFGNGVRLDYNKAVECYKKAPNNDVAQQLLACNYYYGSGVDKNYQQAMELFMKSADLGNKDALEDLSLFFSYLQNKEENKEYYKNVMDYFLGYQGIYNETVQSFVRDLISEMKRVFGTDLPSFTNPRAAFLIGECYRNASMFSFLDNNDISRWYRLAPIDGSAEDSYTIASHLISYGNSGDEGTIRAHLNNAIDKGWSPATDKKLKWEESIKPFKFSDYNPFKTKSSDINEDLYGDNEL